VFSCQISNSFLFFCFGFRSNSSVANTLFVKQSVEFHSANRARKEKKKKKKKKKKERGGSLINKQSGVGEGSEQQEQRSRAPGGGDDDYDVSTTKFAALKVRKAWRRHLYGFA
jgi:hypothetical protein